MNNIKTLYTFSIIVNREIDEVTTTETDGKVITETIKAKKPVEIFFAFKKPSRSERELAEEERAIWWSKYVERGILPEAQLLKLYLNGGGILSEDQKKEYTDLRVQLFDKGKEHTIATVVNKDNKDEHTRLYREYLDLRDKVLAFEQEQSSFFENTAEAKSRVKVADYLVTNLSYWREAVDKPWIPFFKGVNSIEKASDLTNKEEASDELYLLSKDYLYFLASFLFASGYNATTESIDEYLKDTNKVNG